jgi:hypothetical protein
LDANDCASLRLVARSSGALLIFATLDGRTAKRALAHPSELASAVEALLVTGATSSQEAPAATSEHARPPQAAQQNADEAASPAAKGQPPPPTQRDLTVLYTFALGARVGEYALLSPVIGASILLCIDNWELGLRTDVEAQYYSMRLPVERQDAYAIVPAFSFARRLPVGRTTTLLAGVHLGMAALRSVLLRPISRLDDVQVAPLAGNLRRSYEGRTGPFLGVLVPVRPVVRLRVELAADFIWFRTAYTYAVPDWGLSVMVGLELGKL